MAFFSETSHRGPLTPSATGLVPTTDLSSHKAGSGPRSAQTGASAEVGVGTIELTLSEIRRVAAFAVACARPALAIFERKRPGDGRPRAAIDAAQAFADGAERTKALRDSAWAALRAAHEARDAGQAAASDAAHAAGNAAGAAFLHPLAKATQVKHILGSAAHAARAFEVSAGDNPNDGADYIAQSGVLAHPIVVEVLRRFPAAPPGGGRVGELIRQLDASLR